MNIQQTLRFRILPVFLLCVLLCFAASAEQFDLDQNGAFDENDIETMRDLLVDSVSDDELRQLDFDLDGELTVSDLLWIEQALSEGRTQNESALTVQDEVYGKSAMGASLHCTVIEPDRFSRTLMAVFALHGFEGGYDRDGALMVQAAEAMIEYFGGLSSLYGTRMIIVPCANPDGLYSGTSADDFGRCNRSGIDLDHDFDAAHIPMRKGRNFTRSPYSAKESAALRDLVTAYQPDIVLDFHGWRGTSAGDEVLADVFETEMGVRHTLNFNDTMHGSFSNWAHKQGAQTLRVELPGTDFDLGALIYAVERIVMRDLDPSGLYTEDARFASFPEITGYALNKNKITTYLVPGGASSGYISGKSDKCIIEKVYESGWLRIRYPIKEGDKTAFVPMSAFFDSELFKTPLVIQTRKSMAVYSRQNLNNRFSVLRAGEKGYVIAFSNEAGAAQILILEDGSWKLGWIPLSAMQKDSVTTSSFQPAGFTASTLTSEDLQVASGESFTVPLYLNGPAPSAVRLVIEWDASVLEMSDVENGVVMDRLTFSAPDVYPRRVLLENPSGPEEISALLCSLHFVCDPNAVSEETVIRVYTTPSDALISADEPVVIPELDISVSVQSPA